jgi:hypothetical protein
MFNLTIGTGAIMDGSFAGINWADNTYHLKIEMDITGGMNFTNMGTTQFLSVPYAMHAATADSLIEGGPSFSGDYNDLSNQPITISSMSQNGDSLLLSNGQIYTTSNDYNDLVNQPITVDSLSINNDTIYLSNGESLPLMTANTNNSLDIPTLVTSVGDDLGSNGVTLFGVMDNVSNPNTIMEKGFDLDTLPNPNIQSNIFSIFMGAGEENFDYNPVDFALNQDVSPSSTCSPSSIDALFYSPSTTYYARAYVTLESNITIYSNEINFTTTTLGPGPSGGNIVFDLGHNDLGWQYLEISPVPVWEPGIPISSAYSVPLWGPNISLGTSELLGSGPDNTALMMANAGLIEFPTSCQNNGAQYYDGSHFAGLVGAYMLNGFNDWFLPSIYEAMLAAYNAGILNIPSSSEADNADDLFLTTSAGQTMIYKFARHKERWCWEDQSCASWSNPLPIWAFRRY